MNEEEKRSHEKRRRATDGSVFGNSGSGARAEGLILMAEWEMGERGDRAKKWRMVHARIVQDRAKFGL